MADQEDKVVDDITKVNGVEVGICIESVGQTSDDADLSDNVDLVIGDIRCINERFRDRNMNTNHRVPTKRVDNVPGRCGSMESLIDKEVTKSKNGMDMMNFMFPSRLRNSDTRLGGSTPCIVDKKDDLKNEKLKLTLGFEKCKSRSQELKIQNRFDMSPTSSTKRFVALLSEGVPQVCKLSKKDTKMFDDIKYKNLKWEQHYLLLEKDCIKSAKVIFCKLYVRGW